ncbi:MAG: polymerase, sigma-24 subunit, subfamily [Verrucomicrobiales bacterium]|nr:polymerase, sigma-24 subunit, subfamily [Verrucomicrobiales bacterium]
MPDLNDMDLLREYADRDSDPAFAEVVQRHINFVYSVALRYVGNSQDAQDVTQAVFIILAQKAAGLREKTILAGWLYETTRFTAARFMRSKARRQSREQEAHMQSSLSDSDTDDAWERLAPLLEEAMSELGERDRTLLALHFFQRKSAEETAAILGIQKWAARKRVARAVEKLRTFFARRDVSVSAVVLMGAVTTHSVQAAPAALAASISAVAITKGTAASATTLTLIKGTLKMIAWAKVKTAVAVGLTILLVTGTATVAAKKLKWHQPHAWQNADDLFEALRKTPPQVTILRAKVRETPGGSVSEDDKTLGLGMSFESMVEFAYGKNEYNTIISTKLPPDKIDFIANLEHGSREALQAQIKKQFGIIGRFEATPKDVDVLRVKDPKALKLTPRHPTIDQAGMWFEGKRFRWSGQPSSQLASWLGRYFKKPVIDMTDMTTAARKLEEYKFDLNWDDNDLREHNSDKLKKALEEVGFELISTNQSIKILVVEKLAGKGPYGQQRDQ